MPNTSLALRLRKRKLLTFVPGAHMHPSASVLICVKIPASKSICVYLCQTPVTVTFPLVFSKRTFENSAKSFAAILPLTLTSSPKDSFTS